jgi:glycosyltransferase involved in cell wall biosynthesis
MNLTATLRAESKVESSPGTSLHVLTLTPFFPSEGDEVSGCFIAENLKALATLGVTSSVIAVDSIYHRGHKSSPEYPAEWLRYPQLPGNFGLSSAGKFLGRMLLHKVRELHARRHINVIHAHAALPCGHAAAFLSHQLNLPFVVTSHGLDVFNRCFQDGIAAAWRRKASLEVYENASRVICISDRVLQILLEGSSAAVSADVVHNGTDPNFFTPSSTLDGPPTLLVVGTLLAGKGQELVLKAIARLNREYPDLQCQIIGEGADQPRFATLAKQLGIDKRVHFLGRRSRAEVADAMRNCTVFILPSRFEGLGCVYLEAMACGKPVIGCYGQGIEEIIQDGINGGLIPVDGLGELTGKLRTLLSDAELRTRVGCAARRTITDRFTLSHQAQALTKIYEQVAR